jgi:glycosyltransferase involved in cell wall biosynthesis
MNTFPRVTIVTPSYNQAEYLEETIQSVLSQEYQNLEYWVFDGGSTDGSVEIIRKYEKQLAGWVSEPDRGQAEAINKGFSRASGEIVAWVNSDDTYLPGALRDAVGELMSRPDAAFVFGDVLSIDGQGQPINVMQYDDWGLDDLMQFNIIGQPGVFMRRTALERAGYLDLNYHFLLDHQLWLRLAQYGSIHYVPRRWAAARFHPGAKNVAQAAAFGQEAIRIVHWMAGQPDLAGRYQRARRRIWAGAHRMDGRYLLDGGKPGPALRAYLRSLWAYPPIALPESRRILYAAASLLFNVDFLRRRYLNRRQHKVAAHLDRNDSP